MPVRVRALTVAGLARMHRELDELHAGLRRSVEVDDYAAADLSSAFNQCEVAHMNLGNRALAGQYLFDQLHVALNTAGSLNPGLWAWLTLFYWDSVCPLDAGRRMPSERARYIPEPHAWRYYRHLLAGPYLITEAFQGRLDDAMIVLSGRVDAPGDFVGQLAARSELIQNRSIIAAATRLYFDRGQRTPKRGAAPNSRRPGTLRRFVDVLEQLNLTYDLQAMDTEGIIDLLPAEFDPFRQ